MITIFIFITYLNYFSIAQRCTKDKLSLFHLLSAPDDGYPFSLNNISSLMPNVCNDELHKCKIQFSREFLPESTYYLSELQKSKENDCDSILSKALTYWLKSYARIVTRPGYPYQKYMEKVSIGKYVRFNSMIQFHLFHGFTNDHLINFHYNQNPGLGWPWTDENPNCVGNFTNWNCGFRNFNEIVPEEIMTTDELSVLGVNQNETFRLRSEKPNHILQVLLFGKVLEIVSEPNSIIKEYMMENWISVNPNAVLLNYVPSTIPIIEKFKSFSNFKEMTKINSTDNFFTSVTMHVRQGDSCDRIIDEVVTNLTNFKTKIRPCFSINIFMKKLYELKKLYNVKRVYLSTDSSDMIQRTLVEPSFHWIYTNNSRNNFVHGIGWIEYRTDLMNAEILNSTIADLTLMKYGDIFLGKVLFQFFHFLHTFLLSGAYTSHYSKLAWYLMAGVQMRLPPFVSLDYPLTCDYNQNCENNGYNMTVEQMIYHAPGLRYNANFLNTGENDRRKLRQQRKQRKQKNQRKVL